MPGTRGKRNLEDDFSRIYHDITIDDDYERLEKRSSMFGEHILQLELVFGQRSTFLFISSYGIEAYRNTLLSV